MLHASTDKRPSLSLDLMEEFRPLLVDRTVLSLLRSKRLRPEHATTSPDGEGVWLNSKGKKTLVDGYEATLQRQVTEIINQADGAIHLYPLCDSCLARSEVHGTSPALDDAGLYRGVW